MEGHNKQRYRPSHANAESVRRYASIFRPSTLRVTDENTRTCTVKQLVEASGQRRYGGRFILDNRQLYTVRLCGRIVAIDQNENHTDYVLDDGTGVLEGRIWQHNQDGATGLSGAMLGSYYKVIGNLVTNSASVLLQTLKAEAILDHNEITLHFLTAIHEHCTVSTLRREDVEYWSKAQEQAKAYMNNPLSVELNKEAIFSFLSTDTIRSSCKGASMDLIMRELHMESEETSDALREMINEGSVYNTIDANHFQVADNN